MSWLVWGALLLPLWMFVALTTRRVWRMAFPAEDGVPADAAAQQALLDEVGARLATVGEQAGTASDRRAVPRLGPDERADTRWVPPPGARMALHIRTSEGSVRADVADLSQRGFAAHVACARRWRQGELLACTLELLGRPYADLQLRTRYVIFGGDEDPSWRVGFQLADAEGSGGIRALARLVDACEAAKLAA